MPRDRPFPDELHSGPGLYWDFPPRYPGEAVCLFAQTSEHLQQHESMASWVCLVKQSLISKQSPSTWEALEM